MEYPQSFLFHAATPNANLEKPMFVSDVALLMARLPNAVHLHVLPRSAPPLCFAKNAFFSEADAKVHKKSEPAKWSAHFLRQFIVSYRLEYNYPSQGAWHGVT